MARNKNNIAVWNTRIKKSSSLFQKAGSSISFDKRLFKEDIKGSITHVEMLFKSGIISFKIKNKIIFGLNRIMNEIVKKKFNFDNKDEDIHMAIERRLEEIIGEDAGYMHTGRSRNDQVITDLKIWMRKSTKEIIKLLDSSSKIIIKIAEKNIFTVMPGFTHLKNAQAVSFSHYILAYIEMFRRDKIRFNNTLKSLMENPLGAGALSGTSFNIDRNYTTKKLGFNNPTRNSIDSVADRDFVTDFLYSAALCSMHISRMSEDFIIWNSDAFNFINLSDKIVTGSSIMPQKKNPDPLEYLRGKTGSIYGGLFSMLTILKGLPLSYFKDLQDDKKIVFETYDNLKNCILIMNEVLNNFSVNKKKMLELSNKGYMTATDLADYLVKELKYPFRKAYKATAEIVNFCENNNKNLKDLSLEEIQKFIPKIKDDVLMIFNLNNSIESKKSFGGTSFENIKKMLKIYKKDIK